MKSINIAVLEQAYDIAIVNLQKLMSVFGDDVKVYKLLADLYGSNNDPENATKMMEKVYSLDPNNESAIKIMATKAFENEEYAKAETLYIKLTELNPQEIIYFFNLAFIYEKLNDPEKNIATLMKAHLIDSTDSEIVAKIADYYLSNNTKDKAIEYLRKLLSLKESEENYMFLCQSFNNFQMWKDLKECASQWTKFQPKNEDAKIYLDIAKRKVK